MDQHPIPQNVTSFEFHLVGDMTLKQFLYLGAGLGTAYLLYATAFYSLPVIVLPLIILSALLGVSFAFLPIYDLPLDHWVKAFFKAVYAPTIGSWKTKGEAKQKLPLNDPFFKNRLQLYLASMGMSINSWDNIPPISQSKENVPQPTEKVQQLPPKIPTNQELDQLVDMAKQAQFLQTKITETKKVIDQMTPDTNPEKVNQLSTNLQRLLEQTEELYDKSSQMSQITTPILPPQPQQSTQPKIQPQSPLPPQPINAPKVTVIQTTPHKETSMILTSSPNVINGIVSDPAGNYIDNVIVIIHDKDGVPVRALKTNKLGQFVGSTPLSSGVYTITLEKEGLAFQTLQITLENTVLSPIKITTSKGGS